MVRRILFALLASCLAIAQPAPRPRKPKLLLAIVVDQFRQDYFYRFGGDYNSGLQRIWQQGAVFTNAHYEHFPTVTAIGHSTLLSGATPSLSGIVGNEWYDRALKKQITSVTDEEHKLLGASGSGSSPRNLLVSTLVDELKMSGRAPVKAVGISIKDRSAILPIGRMGDAAYWFDNKTGNMVSSSYYFAELPPWVQDFNRQRTADQWLGKDWKPWGSPAAKAFLTMAPAADEKYWASMQRTPFGNELLEAFAERAVVEEKLGQKPDSTDVLAVSFSSNDYVGHEAGPDSPRVRDVSIRTDKVLGRLFAFLEKTVGMQNVLVAFSADHGVAPLPEVMRERRMPGGRIPEEAVQQRIEKWLSAKFGSGKWIVGKSGPAPYLNYELIHNRRLELAAVRREAAQAVRSMPHIFRVYTQDQLSQGHTLDDLIDRRVRNGFHAGRAADVFIVSEPYHIFEKQGTSHGTPFNYDSHVPLVLVGPGIKPGKYHRRAAVNDIAPTLATLLEVEVPAGAVGRVLDEALR
jgi:predicted AlkP superfamily pyrophosphatase or phosphodiesterase